MDVNASQLQHGLVRWVQNYGEHILKTLIARSPKLPHPRRYSNSMLPGGGATALPMNGHGSSNGTSGGIGGLGGATGGGGAGVGGGGGRPPRPSGFGRANKFSSREGMLIPPAYLPTAPFRPHTYPLLGSPTSVYYGMVPSLPAAAVGQMSPTGANAAGGSGSASAGYPTPSGVSAVPNVNQTGVLVPVPPPAVASTMGTPLSLDSSGISGPTQQQPSQNILFMQPIGLPHQHSQQPHLQAQVTLSGSPIQQQEFTRPSSPISFKPSLPIAALSGAGDREGGGAGGVAGSEGSVSLMSSIQQQQAHLIQTQGLVTMTPIMAASASPSSSLNLSHAGMHHVHPHPLSSQHLQAQLHLHQQQAAGSSFGGGGVASGSGIFEHVPQIKQNMRPGLAAAAFPPVSSMFQEQHAITHPLTAPQQQQQQPPPLIAQFHHSGIIAGATSGSGEGMSGAASTTGIGSTNLPLMPVPIHPLSTGGGGVVLPGSQRNESEPLLPNPPIPPLQPAKHVTSVAAGTGGGVGVGGVGGGASHHGPGSQSSNMRKEIPCKHFIAGTCPFGEKCWFAHLEPITQQQREGLVSSRGASSQQLGSPSSGPLQVQIPPNVWINNPNLLFDLSHFAVASPPQSPVNSTLLSSNRPPILPTLIRPRAYYPNFPGQQPLLLVRPPGGTATVFPAGVHGVGMGIPGAIGGGGGAGGGYPFYTHMGQYPTLQPHVNPILKFNLLSEVVIKQVDNTEMVMENITKMITRADHIYVVCGQTINDYKILFGGNRSFQESAVLIESKLITETVSCLHFSKQQPTLMVIGTIFGSIYTWDIRKGATGGMIMPAHKAEITGQPSTSITVLIHFATSINSAQVIVAGNKAGHVTWFISQPPQKTYSVLYCDQTSHAPHPIVALQILGGFLITGDQGGRVILWSMQSQQPVIDSKMIAHSISLCNIHVVDTTRFITIGISPCPDDRLINSSIVDDRSEEPANSGESKTGVPSSVDAVGVSMEGITSDFSRMSVSASPGGLVSSEEHSLVAPLAVGVGIGGTASEAVKTASQHPDFMISVWEFNRPPKLVHSLPINGIVISSSFHYHLPTGNMFLATGMQNGTVKIYNVPSPTFMTLSTASELHFSEMKGKDCVHVAVNLSREVPLSANAYIRNPFRDLILTTAWSDGKIMVCQVARQ